MMTVRTIEAVAPLEPESRLPPRRFVLWPFKMDIERGVGKHIGPKAIDELPRLFSCGPL
jgi:hypothetical protein